MGSIFSVEGLTKYVPTNLYYSRLIKKNYNILINFPGPSKKLAKNAAAKAGLAALCNISYSPMQQLQPQKVTPNSMDTSKNISAELSQTVADAIGRYVL